MICFIMSFHTHREMHVFDFASKCLLQVQLNLMAPNRDNYYGNQQTIQGLVWYIVIMILTMRLLCLCSEENAMIDS